MKNTFLESSHNGTTVLGVAAIMGDLIYQDVVTSIKDRNDEPLLSPLKFGILTFARGKRIDGSKSSPSIFR